jgi:Secretion system C-terminal sorting domain
MKMSKGSKNWLLLFIALGWAVMGLAQQPQKNWLERMQNPDEDFKALQADFYRYWEGRTDYKGNGYKVFKRWEYLQQTLVQPNGKLQRPEHVWQEYNRYMRAWEAQSATMRSAGGNWTSVGPTAYPTNNTGQPCGMGRVNALAFHPTDAATLFAGASNGGFWKSTNDGTTWANLSNNLPRLGVSSVLIHPTDPNTIYIGSGDRDGGDAPGLGVFKSLNGGLSWEQTNFGMGDVKVGAMLMHPSDPNTILAATSGGIYKSTNAGASWALRSVAGEYRDIRFKPGDPTVVYATRMITPSEFYRSADGGNTWTQITAGIPSAGIGSRMVVGVSAANPSVVYLVQILASDETFAGLLKSSDAGLTFTTQSTSPNIFDYSCVGSGTSSQATYDLCISVDPANADVIYVGSINNWKSINGGVNWTIVSHWVGSDFSSNPTANCAVSVHADQHVYERSPLNGRLYLGNDGGVYYTADNGATWPQISNNIGINQLYRIGQSQLSNNVVLMGLQDNGSMATSNGSTFTCTRGGDGAECLVDYSNANYCFNTYVNGQISCSSTGPTGGYNNVASNGTNGITEPGPWVTPYFLHRTVPTTMFAGYRNVWRTTNVRATPTTSVAWQAISTGETNDVIALDQSAADVNVIYAVRSGAIKRTDNANAAPASVVWTACALPAGLTPNDLKTDPTDPNKVYCVVDARVFKSINKGASWTEISGSLPNLEVNCLVLDRNGNEAIYIGNQTSVWYRDATLGDWILFSNGLPPADVRELEIYYDLDINNNRIKAGTYGRGLWQSDLIEVKVLDPTNFAATPFSTSQIDLTWVRNPSNNDVLVAVAPTTSDIGRPADGVAYISGNPLPGGGTVVYVGNPANFSHTGLALGTNYCYRAWSVNASQEYSAGVTPVCAKTFSYNWTGGASTTDWFTPGNWGPNLVPTVNDGAFIPTGLAFYPNITANGAICKDLSIEAGASVSMSGTTGYTLTVAGNWANNGTFNRGIGTVAFSGSAALQTISGTSTTAFYNLSITKTAQSQTVEAKSLITLNGPTNPLTLTTGTFKVSSASTLTPWTASTSIGSSAILWVNGATILPAGMSVTLNGGTLRISAGSMGVGTSSGNGIIYLNGGTLIMEGGSLTVAGRFSPNSGTSSGTYSQTGGTATINAVGSTSSTRAVLELNTGVPFTFSGGSLIIRRSCSHTTADVIISSTTSSVTGGTFQVGDASTPAAQVIRINTVAPLHHFTVNATNNPEASLVTNALTVQGNLSILGGTLRSNSLAVNARGNWTNNGSFVAGTGTVTFNGTAAQTISGSTATTFNNWTVNNAAGVSQSSVNVNVSGVLNLTAGIVNPAANLLILADNATVTGGSNTAYVAGQVRKVGNDAFSFPVGNGGYYAPIGISAPGSVTDHFTASYAYNDPDALYSRSLVSAPIVRVSSTEYWTLNRTNGSSTPSVTLSWSDVRSSGVSSLADLHVARWDGSTWVSEGNTTTTGAATAGTVTSIPVANFSPFTLSTINGLVNNFPITLIQFKAAPVGTMVLLDWETASENGNDYFTVERSLDAAAWEDVVQVDGAGTSTVGHTYEAVDERPIEGLSYYRLRSTDFNGQHRYSELRTVNFSPSSNLMVFPNPVNQTLYISYGEGDYTVEVRDLTGRLVAQAANAQRMDTHDWAAGTYMLTVRTASRAEVRRVVVSH